MEANKMLSAINEYHLMGWNIIPLKGKRAILPEWQNTKLTQNELIPYINQGHNIGVICGGNSRLMVVDWDSAELFEDYENEFPDQCYTGRVRTNKGYHLYYIVDITQELPSNGNFYYKGQHAGEIKSTNGYVVAPPSVHPESAKIYEWEIPPTLIKTVQFNELGLSRTNNTQNTPERTKTRNVKNPAAYIKRALDTAKRKITNAEPGERNKVISSNVMQIAKLMGEHLTEQTIYNELFPAAQSVYNAALPEDIKDIQGLSKVFECAITKGRQEKITLIINNTTNDEILPHWLKYALNEKWEFRYNVIKGCLEYRERGGEWVRITDRDVNTIRFKITEERQLKSVLSKQLIDSLLESDFSREHHFFKDYFDSLDKWDGTTDYIKQLADTVTVPEEQRERWCMYLKRWMIGSVATMLERGINHYCLTLVGAQGVGKTSWLNGLGLNKDYYYCGNINVTDKDTLIKVSEYGLINLDELESSTKADWSWIKSIITTPKINVRRPYGRYDEELKRHASFTASVNDSQILGDATGTRRWLVVDVRAINYTIPDRLKQNAYAQALALLEAREKYWFDGDEIVDINENNRKYHQPSHEEDLLMERYKPGTAHRKTTTDIFNDLMVNFKGKISIRKLGQALSANGFEKIMDNITHRYVWLVDYRDCSYE